MNCRLSAVLAAVLVAVAPGVLRVTQAADSAPTGAGQVLAKGGSVELTAPEVRSMVAALPEESRKSLRASLPALEQLLRAEIAQRALLTEARAKGFDRDPGTARQLERLQQELVVRLWLASQTSVPVDYPSDAEVKAAYDAARAARPLEYHIAQIFISAPSGADPARLTTALRKVSDLAARLPAGDFAQLAREQSEHAESAAKGGDLGFVGADRMLPDILKSVQTLAPGQLVGPLKTTEGFHFVKLIESRPVALPPLAEVRTRLIADLRARRAQDLQRAYLAQLNSRLAISINEIELGKLQATLN